MGRGGNSQALEARDLLYGPRRLGSGPVLEEEREYQFADLFDQIESGKLTVAKHRLVPPKIDLRNNESGQDYIGEYAQAEVTNIWDEPVGLLFRSGKKDNWLLVNYSSFDYDPEDGLPAVGTHKEMAFLKSLAQSFPGDERIQFSFESDYQLDSFMSAYGPSPFKVVNHLSYLSKPEPSQQKMLQETADCGVLADEQRDALKRCANLTEAWADPEGREALRELADHGELCLGRPLKEFAQMVI